MAHSFESGSLDNVDLTRAHAKAEKVLAESTISMQDFVEPYGEETIRRDLETIERREKSFRLQDTESRREMKMVAEVFEAIVLEHGELSNWFGDNAVTLKTSKFDDYENGVDAVIEFRSEEPGSASFLGMAADVTFTSDTTSKFDRLKAQIDRGELARVKYFHSVYMNIHGQLSRLPEVIIGADKRTVMEITELWMARENKKLAAHRIQIMILKQMQAQLKTFGSYARSIGQEDVAVLYDERLRLVEAVLEEKKDLVTQTAYELDNDSVHSSIMAFLRRWQQTIGNAV